MVHLLYGWAYADFFIKVIFLWAVITYILLFMTLFWISKNIEVAYQHLFTALLQSIVVALLATVLLSYGHVIFLMKDGLVQEVLLGYFYMLVTMFEMIFMHKYYKQLMNSNQTVLGMIAFSSVICLAVTLSLLRLT